MSHKIACGLLVMAGLLVVAAFLVRILQRCRKTPELERVWLRVKSWACILVVFSSFFVLPVPGVVLVFGLLAGLSVWEIVSSFFLSPPFSGKAVFLGIIVCALLLISWFSGYVVYSKSQEFFFFAAVLTQLNDVFQYLWGKGLGKHAILPTISPAKTWEGFLGGIATSACVAYAAAPYFVEIRGWAAILCGGALAVGGFAGDATLSALKRQLKIKDFGTLLPGHGGLADRIDSLLYVWPALAIFL